MLIKTKNHEKFHISEESGKSYFSKGSLKGVIDTIKGVNVGDKLEIWYYKIDRNTQSKSLSYIKSSEIIEII